MAGWVMSKKLELIIQVSLAILIIAAAAYLIYAYSGKYIDVYELNNNGVSSKAELKMKGVLVNGEIKIARNTLPSDHHQFMVSYRNPAGNEVFCRLPVSKKRYDSNEPGDLITVKYLASSPGTCMLSSEVDLNYNLLTLIMSLGAFFAALGLIFLIYIYIQYKRPNPGQKVELTTGFDKKEVNCPECGKIMKEGYIPSVGGISWRDREESTGIPTILSGLPGTIYWLKRPKLHAFRCRECKVVVFKHG